MNNKKSTKRTLLTSVLSLVLCMAMLIGTTFAWFTDSVTSGNNIIKSGNLDIELEYYNEDTKEWKTVEGASDLFTSNLWEPGHTEVVYLKLTNKGTLALKYQLGVNIVSETGSVNVEGDNFKLSQYIEYGVVEGKEPSYAKREDAVAAVENDSIAIASGYSKSGNMEKQNDPVYLAMVVFMPETVGNEANYATGTAVPTINLGVNLVANQYTYEEDSFDNQYDSDAYAIVEKDGIEYAYDGEEVILYNVTGNYVGDTVVVPQGVTTIGNYAFANNSNVKSVVLASTVTELGRGFDSSAVENVVLNEGLEKISSRAFRKTSNLTTLVIPSSVTTIEENAFQQSGLTRIVIPESVTFIGNSAFQHNDSLEAVTIEGSPVIENYAFRACSSLKEVYLLGENTTFTGTSMAFCNLESGKSDDITIYVMNDTVAAAVETANGSCTGYAVVTPQDETADLDFLIDNANDGDVIFLGTGSYIIPDSAQGKTLTISGSGDTNIATQDDGSYEGCDYSLDGSTVTFNNVTITTDGSTYTGYARMSGTYNNCVINNTYTLYGDSEFNNCTFNVSGDSYNIWTWGAPNVEFNGCTFNTSGKALFLNGTVNTNMTVNNCVFNDDNAFADVNNKAAIEIGDDYGKSYTLIINNIKVNGFDVTTQKNPNRGGTDLGTNVWGNKNLMTADNLDVIIDGVEVY